MDGSIEAALGQQQDCICFLQQQQAAWEHRMQQLQEIKKQGLGPGGYLGMCIHKEISMMRGVLLTLKRRLDAWKLFQASLVAERGTPFPSRPEPAQGQDAMWSELDEILASMPVP